ncbi:amino acid/polyamine/organocation transporter (APC superfamily) [Williamsia limnetica]|uniref:Amino acid/polyamine/organocation transporter (APC superfamily) n=1 Tax=Williamsia limnetica TaxID=882452 RepID=A0A318RCH7_WILLI|nr:amino acid permease [Williamsia limnetica]PYE13084.1 amino acid/polyamine/organocation transporter (APC superfamily) [Williamsia limnetica]
MDLNKDPAQQPGALNTRTLFRRKPIPTGDEAEADTGLERTITTTQLACFGIGATIGTGIFFVMSVAVPDAGPSVVVAFIVAGIAAGLAAICYAEMASSVPVSGSTYSYAYATLGEIVAMAVAACLLLEYGVSTAAVAVGWSEYLNALLGYLHIPQIPHALSAAPWDADPGVVNLPAIILVGLCALLLIRGASESAKANMVMVAIKLAVLAMFIAIAFAGFNADNLSPFFLDGANGVTAAAGVIFFSFIGLDAVSTAGEEVKDPQRTMPRALIAALVTVVLVYVLVALAAVGAQQASEFEGQEAGLAAILEKVTGETWPSLVLSLGAVISIFSVTLVTLYGQTRILFAMGRDGMLPKFFTRVNPRTLTPVNNTVVVAIVVALLAGFVPLDYLIDMVSIGTLTAFSVVSLGVILLRRREPDLYRPFKVPFYPVTPILAIAACIYILYGLHWYTYLFFLLWVGVVLVYYLVYGRKHSLLNITSDPLGGAATKPGAGTAPGQSPPDQSSQGGS